MISPSMQTHSISFFDRLPYDVRFIIYGYLEPTPLPPRSIQFQAYGFLLSCRQAKTELEEIACQRLETFLVRFRRSATFPMVFKRDSGDLRHLTVELPFSTFVQTRLCGPGMRVKWKKDVLATLHQLFTQYFDVVHIHVSHRDEPSDEGPSTTPSALGLFEIAMQGLLRDVEYIIKRVNSLRGDSEAHLTMDGVFYGRGDESQRYPNEHVKTRRICMSWDLRSKKMGCGVPVNLNGRLHHAKLRASGSEVAASNHCQIFNQHTPTLTPNDDPFLNRRPMYYHLHGHQRLVGEMGLQCHDRWSEPHSWNSNELLNGLDETAEYVCSEHTGAKLQLGLRGITEAEYRDEEAKIFHALWDT